MEIKTINQIFNCSIMFPKCRFKCCLRCPKAHHCVPKGLKAHLCQLLCHDSSVEAVGALGYLELLSPKFGQLIEVGQFSRSYTAINLQWGPIYGVELPRLVQFLGSGLGHT